MRGQFRVRVGSNLIGSLPAVLAAFLVFLAPLPAPGQEHVLTGRVIAPDSAPIRAARVHATGDQGQVAETRTDAAGNYRLSLRDASSSYALSVAAPGFQPITRVVDIPPGVRAVANFQLSTRVVALEPIEVRATRLSVAEAARWTPGSVDQARLGVGLRTEPLGADAASDLTVRQVGVAQVAGSEGPGISMMGQRPDQTRLTMDGAELGAAVVPREAIRSVDVLTNTFDVARGRFTGGQVNVRTQQAGNAWGGTFRLESRDPRLQYGDTPDGLRSRSGYLGLDAGAGGALVRDRIFAFGAITARRTDIPALSVTSLSPWGLRQLGLSPDSLSRFLDATAALRPQESTEERQAAGLASGLLRLDAVLSTHHALTFRLNGQVSAFPDQGSASGVSGTGSELRGSNLGILAQVSSGGTRIANELKIHFAQAERRWTSEDPAPEGVVNLAPAAGDASLRLTSLRFAGSPLSTSDSRQEGFEVTDQIVLTTADRRHRFRVGGEGAVHEYARGVPNSTGAFLFENLADVERNQPALFTRSFAVATPDTRIRRAAFFLDDHWRPGGLELSYGLRAERVEYTTRAAPNEAVGALFGRTPGDIPAGWRISPRLGFSFDTRMPWDGIEGSTAIQGGIGEFVGSLSPTGVAGVLAETGDRNAAELVCVGPEAPKPDWNAYRANPATIPTACADGSSPFASRVPRATLFAGDFGPPRAWRAALHGQGLLGNGIIWSLAFSWLRGSNQPVAFDRNLVPQPSFRNQSEGDRPVFASLDAIDPETGLISVQGSRRFSDFGVVREITGAGRSRALQATATAAAFLGPIGFLGPMQAELGYTWTDSQETVAPLGALAGSLGTTAGDPSRLEWAPGTYSPRHTLHMFAEWRQSSRVSFGASGSISSGRPYTPMVAGDVNGDGVPNDRAFVFDPANPLLEERVRLGMDRLLTTAPPRVQDCLRTQTGRVVAHNSCWTRWSPSLDLNARFHFGPRIDGSTHKRLTLWIVARNVPAGLDYLLRGSEELRGWGQDATVDNTLLVVRGFDPAARAFKYDVNPRFGTPGGDGAIYRQGFTVSIQGRFVLGSDRVLAQFRQAMTAAALQDPAAEAANLRAHLVRQLVNFPAEVLSLNGPEQLALLPTQARALQQAADSLAMKAEVLIEGFMEAIGTPQSGAPDPQTVRLLVQEAIAWRAGGLQIVRSVLTPEQWARIPEELRRTSTSFAPSPPRRLTAPSDF